MLLIQNGRVLDPYTQMDALRDVLIGDDGVIAQVAEHIDAPAGCTVYDASGLTVSPGFVDGHVHFRDPGQTQKGRRADRCGGGSRRRLRHGNLHGEHRADLRHTRDHPLR